MRVRCMVCGKVCTAKEASEHEHNLWELVYPPPIKEREMCNRCIYKNLCRFVVVEMNKNACDTPCWRFVEIPPFQATENEEQYLV